MAQWVQTISDAIDSAFNFIRPALVEIPSLIMLCSVIQRPGISVINIVANVIRRQAEANAYTGMMPDGSPNVVEKVYAILVDEIVKEIRLNARVDIVIPPGAITSFGTGANSGGPVTIFSTNTSVISGKGIVR